MTTFRGYFGALRAILQGNATLSRPRLHNEIRQTWRRTITSGHVANAWLRQARFRGGKLGPSTSRGFFLDAAPHSRSKHPASPLTSPFRRLFHSSKPRRSQAAPKQETAEPQSLSARMKKLSRDYGWAAVGIYLSLSVLDFPFCFLLVRVVGTDKIAAIEEWVVSRVSKVIPLGIKEWWHEYRASLKAAEAKEIGDNKISEDIEMAGWGVKEAQEAHTAEASLATQLALAYAIHKSFIFVRVPLAAAVTPKVVKVLRSWGWKVGKRPATKR